MAHRPRNVNRLIAIGAILAAAALTAAAQSGNPAPPATSQPTTIKSAFDKATLEAYVRHLFVWPDQVKVTVSDPEPGPIPGFSSVKVRGAMGAQSQEETFYVSKDGQHIIRGNFYDVNQNPFKPELEKLKTELQPSFGTPGAPVVLVEFSDFECPYCREEAKSLRANLLAAYPTQVRLYFLDYPLDSLHPWARAASGPGMTGSSNTRRKLRRTI